MRFFFYGTLMDADLRGAVLRDRAPREAAAAVVNGWRRLPVARQSFPIVRGNPRSRLDGVVVRGLDRVALARLQRYEGRDYRLVRVQALSGGKTIIVNLFVPCRRRLQPDFGDWDLDAWRQRHKRRTLVDLARLRPAR